MPRAFSALWPVLFIFMLASPAHAVIYDAVAYMDSLEEEGFFGDLRLRGGLTTGNTDERRLAGQTAMGFQEARHTLLLTASGQYARTRDETFMESTLQHLRHRFMFSRHWGSEAFVQNERDRFRRIELRALGGAGVRFEADFPGGQLAAGTALMAERMLITRGDGESEDETNLRSSNYISLDAHLTETSRFRLTGYLQPKVTDIADTRLSARASIRANITDHFFTEIYSGIQYDTTPAQTVAPLDTSSGFAIGFDFRPARKAASDPTEEVQAAADHEEEDTEETADLENGNDSQP